MVQRYTPRTGREYVHQEGTHARLDNLELAVYRDGRPVAPCCWSDLHTHNVTYRTPCYRVDSLFVLSYDPLNNGSVALWDIQQQQHCWSSKINSLPFTWRRLAKLASKRTDVGRGPWYLPPGMPDLSPASARGPRESAIIAAQMQSERAQIREIADRAREAERARISRWLTEARHEETLKALAFVSGSRRVRELEIDDGVADTVTFEREFKRELEID